MMCATSWQPQHQEALRANLKPMGVHLALLTLDQLTQATEAQKHSLASVEGAGESYQPSLHCLESGCCADRNQACV